MFSLYFLSQILYSRSTFDEIPIYFMIHPRPTIKLVHVMTRFTNWESMSYEKFLNQDVSHLKIPHPQKQLSIILKFIKLWDEMYELSFFEFRKGLHDISKETFDMMEFDETIELRNLKTYAESCSEECYFLISDDDDWYNPAVGPLLRIAKSDVVSWDDAAINEYGKLQHRSSKNGNILWTNSYAISKKAYLKLNKKGQESLKWHNTARNTLLKKNANLIDHTFLPGHRYSIACKTPASYCKYASSLDDKDRSIRYLADRRRRYVSPEPSEETKWAKNQIEQLALLFDSLYGITSAT